MPRPRLGLYGEHADALQCLYLRGGSRLRSLRIGPQAEDKNAIRTTPAHLVDILLTMANISGGLKPELIPEAPRFPDEI